MSHPMPPGEPEPGNTPPPAPGWGGPQPEQPYGPADPTVPYPPQHGPPPGQSTGHSPYDPQAGQPPYGQQGQHYGQGYGSYPPPGSGGPWYPSGPVTNQKAQWSLAIGLLSVPIACCSTLLGLVGIVAVVLGVQARREITASRGQQSGEGLAMTGIVAGVVGTLTGIVLALLLAMLMIGGELLVTTQ